ncbi:MAG: extracellular solute-binding protein [Thermoleophilia bacterium]|nr:extracellular solute-binding protein [Thermoleophilia bacterium]
MEQWQEQEYEFRRRAGEERIERRRLLRRGLAVGIGLTVLSLSETALAARAHALADPPLRAKDMSLADLIREAKREKTLNTIALPRDWASYGELMDTFQAKYGIAVVNADPNASSAGENEAVRSSKGDPGSPDVLDVNPSAATDGANEGLYAKYFTTNFGKVPRAMKDGRGFWVGGYWGAVSFGVNRSIVQRAPKSWADLLKPEYKNKIALNGNPLSSGSAVAGVLSASIANGGSITDIGPGIEFFAKLKQAGNFLPVQATSQTIALGQTPIVIDWDYLSLAYAKDFPAAKIQTVIPADAVYGSYYCQAISAAAPHPFAARLWQEFLYSDQGQLLWLKGYSHPALFQDLIKRNVVPKSLINGFPNAAAYEKLRFANKWQVETARARVTAEWPSKVG